MSDCCTTLISAFLKAPSMETAGPLIAFYRTSDDPDAVADLARALADSGSRLDFPGRETADIASTGGPSSLSTLLCPLFLAHSGFAVPKLGVQGRPAGGIDVMAQLPGFNIAPSAEQIHSIIKECRFAHFLADQAYAPADQTLFHLRQQLGAQAVRNLVVGSILSKKLAVGVQLAGLEVRAFAGGNFGADAATASANASFFKRVAAELAIVATVFVTDCTVPYQPYIGRGEALEALYELFYGEPSEWLLRHATQCFDFASQTRPTHEREDIRTAICDTRPLFEAHLRAHGSSLGELQQAAFNLNQQQHITIPAQGNGHVVYNLTGIRDYLVDCQRSIQGQRFADPVGMILLKEPHQPVAHGEPVIRLRINGSGRRPQEHEELFSIHSNPNHSFEMRVI
jgi:pyrimidine-nucleoside phosphorylase